MPNDLRMALRTLVRECKDHAARTYAQQLLSNGNWMTLDERRTQILYILSNTGGWRGDTARSVKGTLKAY